jgi:hypothetical protein
MSYKQHGWFSLILMATLFSIAIVSLLTNPTIVILSYLLITLLGGIIVVYSFCAKCPIRTTSCRHIIVGPLTRILPERKQGSYSAVEIFFTALAILAITGFPQFALLSKIPLFIIYWVTAVVLVLEITLFICRGCGNVYCPVRQGTLKNHKS